MREVELYAGDTIDTAVTRLKEMENAWREVAYAVFNGITIYSTDSVDECYKKITGRTKAEFDDEIKAEREEYKRKEREWEERIPEKTEEYRQRARGLVLEDQLEYWDRVVPIRLGDLYHGLELEQVLQVCAIMRDETLTYDERLKKAYDLFQNSGHSGMSASLTASMIKVFCPDGEDLADAVMNFRFEKKD